MLVLIYHVPALKDCLKLARIPGALLELVCSLELEDCISEEELKDDRFPFKV